MPPIGDHDGMREIAHHPGRRHDLVDRLALYPQTHEEGADLRRGGLAVHDQRQGRTHLLGAKIATRGEPRQSLLQGAHVRPAVKKFRSRT